jgi:hypothetical protein
MISSTLKLNRVSKLKFPLVAAAIIGFASLLAGCKKTTTTQVVSKDTVYYSPWMTISMNPTDAGDTAYTETVSASSITASVLSGGAVLTYLGSPGYPNAGDTAAESAVDFGLYSTLLPASIELESYGYMDDFSTDVSQFLFRYVVIPGTVLETTGLTRTQLKSMNFTEITNVLNKASKQASSPAITTP